MATALDTPAHAPVQSVATADGLMQQFLELRARKEILIAQNESELCRLEAAAAELKLL
jgi:hypothetical protein